MIFSDTKKKIEDLTDALGKASLKISELERRSSLTRAILESMVEGVIAIDKDARILSINPSIEKIFGISKDESEGRIFLEAIRNNDISEIIDNVLKKGEFASHQLSLLWPVQKDLKINATPIFEKGLPIGCLLVIYDITQIRKLETMRSDFIANVSHELKTPLTSIKGFVETLLEGALEDKENGRHFLKIIQDHVNRLDSLVNDLLDLSYLESKEAFLKKEDIKLKVLVDDVLAGFTPQVKKKAVEAINELSSDIKIKADKDKINQVFTNLIDNAIKFNRQKGSVKIYSQDVNNKVKIIVEDSGSGIPAKDLPRIFERFYRVDKARSRELGGTGLGLSIVKHIVELHKGDVGVESTEGLGSKFWFSLPK